jgi:hypothetical protein
MADPFPSPSPMVTPSALPPSIDIPTLTFASLAPNGGSFFENFQLGQQESLPPFNSEEFAAEITEPRVAGEPCGLGFLCDEDRMVNCTVIRAISIFFGFGDIHAGLTCPANVSYYQNCQVGFYCPTPVRTLKTYHTKQCTVLQFIQTAVYLFKLQMSEKILISHFLSFDVVNFTSAGTGIDIAVSRRHVLSSQGGSKVRAWYPCLCLIVSLPLFVLSTFTHVSCLTFVLRLT